MPQNIVTPVGRIVWGHPMKALVVRDDAGNPRIGKDGQPRKQWAFGLAIPKDQCGPVFNAMNAAVAEVFPNGAPQNFAYKFKDGDGTDDKGKSYAERDGWAGHYVFTVSTEAFCPKVVRKNAQGIHVEVAESEVKTGDYVVAALNMKAHQGATNVRGSKPGLYINPDMILFVGQGEAITGGPNADELFGNVQVNLPPGATPPGQAPTAPGVPGQAAPTGPGVPGQAPTAPAPTAPAGVPGGAGVPGTPTASPTNATPAPAHDFVQNAGVPGVPGQQ